MADNIVNYEMPTPEEMEKFPSLKAAWDEYLVIRKLTLGDKGIIVPKVKTKINPSNWSITY